MKVDMFVHSRDQALISGHSLIHFFNRRSDSMSGPSQDNVIGIGGVPMSKEKNKKGLLTAKQSRRRVQRLVNCPAILIVTIIRISQVSI